MNATQAQSGQLPGRPPVLGFSAFSGAGKTTLLARVLPLLKARGLRIGLVKHAHHSFEIDTPGKDSYRLREAGADQLLIASSKRWVLMNEGPTDGEGERPHLDKLLPHLDGENLDLILVEGFKFGAFPKIEIHRPSLGRPRLYPKDANIVAFATDEAPAEPPVIPVLDLNRPEQIAEFVLNFLGKEISLRRPPAATD